MLFDETEFMKIQKTALKYIMISLSIYLSLIIISCKKEKKPETNEVWMKDISFTPLEKTISKGTTITWINKDHTTHTATGDNNLFNSGNMSKDQSFSYTFNTAGTFSYKCTIHSTMQGKIIVQ